MQDYTVDTLVALIKTRGAIPTNQQLFTAAVIADMANDEMKLNIVPLIMSVREEYFATYEDQVLVSGQNSYDIPSDAIGMSLDDVYIVRAGVEYPLPRLSRKEASAGNAVTGYYIYNNKIVLYPLPTDTTPTLRLCYSRRPLKLTPNVNGGQVTDITGNVLTLSFVPAIWDTGDKLNSVNDNQPFETTNAEMTIVTSSSPTVEVDDVTGVSIGDWVSVQGESIIPQILEEAHPTLAQATVVKLLEALGDREGMKAAEAKLEQNKKDLLTLINPRVSGAPKKISGKGIL
jgi:hypothetical protein